MSSEKCTVNIWIKEKTVKVVFSDNQMLFQKECDSFKEAEQQYDLIKQMLSKRGHEIKLQDLEK